MAVLFASLLDQAKTDSDKLSDGSITDARWLVFINRGVKSLWRLLTSLDPELYFTPADFTLTGGISGATKDLATLTGFRVLHGLDVNPDTSSRRTVPRRNFADRNNVRFGWWIPGPWADDRQYDIRGRILTITPFEASAGVYRAYYRQAPYLFTSTVDATPLDPVMEDYDEYISLMAGRRGLEVEESDSGPAVNRLRELIAEITEAHTRDEGQMGIADVELYD